jgi:flavorubredoxin
LQSALREYQHLLKIWIPRAEETLDLGNGHQLQFISVPTPRWPDGLCTYDPASRILFTDKLFGCHVCADEVFDENWKRLDEDRRFYYDCLMPLNPGRWK